MQDADSPRPLLPQRNRTLPDRAPRRSLLESPAPKSDCQGHCRDCSDRAPLRTPHLGLRPGHRRLERSDLSGFPFATWAMSASAEGGPQGSRVHGKGEREPTSAKGREDLRIGGERPRGLSCSRSFSAGRARRCRVSQGTPEHERGVRTPHTAAARRASVCRGKDSITEHPGHLSDREGAGLARPGHLAGVLCAGASHAPLSEGAL